MPETNLDPNWLAQDLAEASSDLALSISPDHAEAVGLGGRLSPDDASRLRRKMAARYRAWTGSDLLLALSQDETREGTVDG